ncbi:MAG: SDR family NAD(P)-dependent oxidoreductase [Myxococcota bacterium]
MNTSAFGFESTAEEVTEGLDLSGKRYVVTGCNSGLGFETVRVLALRGAHVVGTARTIEKATAALEEAGSNGTPLACELSDPHSVQACAKALTDAGHSLDGIICNAGVMALPSPQTTLGYDLQFLTNHIGHFILVTGAASAITDDGRVVVVSSGAHRRAPDSGIEFDNLSGERDYAPWKMYGQSKVANILFANELAKRWEGSSRTANSLHPGVIRTNLSRHLDNADTVFSGLNMKTIPQGAATQCLVATHPALATASGKYFADCQEKEPTQTAQDAALAAALWTRSEAIAAELLS